MSPESSDVVRRHSQAFESGGVDAAAEFWDPDIEWRAVEGAADDIGPIRGHQALRRYHQDWMDTLEERRAEVTDIIFEAGGRVAAAVHNSGRGRRRPRVGSRL